MMRGFSVIRYAAVIAAAALAVGLTDAVGGSSPSAFASTGDQAADILALQATQACYGRAQDVVYRNYASESQAKSEGITAFEQCFTANAHVVITVHGTQLLDSASNIPDWVNFVYNFGRQNGIVSTRHLIGNTEVKLTGDDSAVVYSSGITPHFVGQGAGASTPSIDWITGNYRSEVHRINGRWLITSLLINADEFARTDATYPLGVSDGSGNIGFPDPSTTAPVAP
jgi:hypothetical protein